MVLLLHGGGQTRHSWRNTGRSLAADGWSAIAVDARGHGDSQWAPDGDYGIDALVADLTWTSNGQLVWAIWSQPSTDSGVRGAGPV